MEITATCGIGAAPTARATLDATTERTMILAELYRQEEGWRLRAVGQDYDHGLATSLAVTASTSPNDRQAPHRLAAALTLV
ncbi:TerD family protein [Streptomyces sp. NPDC055210]